MSPSQPCLVGNYETKWIPGTFALDSSHNFDNYLKKIGITYFLRQLAALATPVISINQSMVSEKLSFVGTKEVSTQSANCFAARKETPLT